MRKKAFLSGWCQSGHGGGPYADRFHDKCHEVLQVARITPAGKELREVVCSCECHK